MPARRTIKDSAFLQGPAVPAARVAAGAGERKSKYGVLLAAKEVEQWEDLCAEARRLVGRRVTKSEILRAMLALVADDVALKEQLLSTLPTEGPLEE